MRSFTTLLAAAIILSSTPALAAKHASQDKQPAADKSAATATASAQSPDPRYCIDQSPDESTGSRIYTHECHTKAEWAKLGIDVDEAQRQQ